jgi:hypothetical protein
MQRDRLQSLANCIRERWVFPGGQRRWLKVKLFRWCIFALDLLGFLPLSYRILNHRRNIR